MQDLLVVSVFDGQANLREPVEHLILTEVLRPAVARLNLRLSLDLALQVAIVAVVHDDAKFALLSFVDFAEARYIGMVEHFEDLGLFEGFFAFFFVHLADVDLLDHRHLLVRLALHEVRHAEGARAESRHLFVGLVSLSLFVHHFVLIYYNQTHITFKSSTRTGFNYYATNMV